MKHDEKSSKCKRVGGAGSVHSDTRRLRSSTVVRASVDGPRGVKVNETPNPTAVVASAAAPEGERETALGEDVAAVAGTCSTPPRLLVAAAMDALMRAKAPAGAGEDTGVTSADRSGVAVSVADSSG